jgi:hypothetical protein
MAVMQHGEKDGKKDYCSMCSDDGKGGFEESLAEEQTWLRMVLPRFSVFMLSSDLNVRIHAALVQSQRGAVTAIRQGTVGNK